VNEVRRPSRTGAEWEPFMERLRSRLVLERGRRRLRRAAGALLALALLWMLGAGPRRGVGRARLLLAEVPSAAAPLFEPSAGSAVRLPSGALLVRTGGGS